MKRRNKKDLESRIQQAKTKYDKAIANFKLALFHDNNNRENEAIPYYKSAISLGLDTETKSEALAWLASSLFKTNQSKEAIGVLRKSRKLTKSKELLIFLEGLEQRIKKSKL